MLLGTYLNLMAAAQGDTSRHLPLQESQIRLLKIHPGKAEDVIKVSLVTVDLEDAPPYEALSYVWGDISDPMTIQWNDQALHITQGLFEALSNLRNSSIERLIWVDAICIDQTNLCELGQQVSIMDKIYSNAKSVVVFLGKATEHTEQAFQILKYFIERDEEKEEPPWSFTHLSDVEKSLQDIMTRPWFTRIWTVQEAALAQHTTLVCGDFTLSWRGDLPTLRSIVFRIKAEAISPYFSATSWDGSKVLNWAPLLDILETQMRQAARREGVTLQRNQLDIAYDFRDRQSTNPRDKYFAVFNIMRNDKGGELLLQPDYTMEVDEVHRQFTSGVWLLGEKEDMIGGRSN
jgi:hypothetical protein